RLRSTPNVTNARPSRKDYLALVKVDGMYFASESQKPPTKIPQKSPDEEKRQRAEFWRTARPKGDPAEREMPRAKRERVHRYYSHVISLALSALDDGSKSPPPSRELIEWLLDALGYHVTEWTRLTDEELANLMSCPSRLKDEITYDRVLSRIRKQRERLLAWQDKPGNPILINHRHFFEHAADSEPGNPKGKHYSEYKLPFGELVAEIVAECPVGTRNDRLKRVIKRQVDDYGGTQKREKGKREHSPESDLNRAAAIAKKAFDRKEKRSGRQSAINAFRAAFEREFGEFLQEVFFDNSSEI